MKSELKLLVAALRSEKENSEKDDTPAPPADAGSVPMEGGWVWVWSWACCCSFSGCVSVRKEDAQQPMTQFLVFSEQRFGVRGVEKTRGSADLDFRDGFVLFLFGFLFSFSVPVQFGSGVLFLPPFVSLSLLLSRVVCLSVFIYIHRT
jgi:hypothetical protein